MTHRVPGMSRDPFNEEKKGIAVPGRFLLGSPDNLIDTLRFYHLLSSTRFTVRHCSLPKRRYPSIEQLNETGRERTKKSP